MRTTQRCCTGMGIIGLCIWCVIRELNQAPFDLNTCPTVKRVPEVFIHAWTIRSSQMFTRWREHRLSEYLVPRTVGNYPTQRCMFQVPKAVNRWILHGVLHVQPYCSYTIEPGIRLEGNPRRCA